MFEDIGNKIKFLAKTLCCLGVIASLILGGYIIADGISENSVGRTYSGILTATLGSLFSWIGNFIIYGFGQLVENSDKLVEKMDFQINRLNIQSSPIDFQKSSTNNQPISQTNNVDVQTDCLDDQFQLLYAQNPNTNSQMITYQCPHCGRIQQIHKNLKDTYSCPHCFKKSNM